MSLLQIDSITQLCVSAIPVLLNFLWVPVFSWLRIVLLLVLSKLSTKSVSGPIVSTSNDSESETTETLETLENVPKKMTVFVHMRKCGGTSIVHALRAGDKVKFPALHRNGNAWVPEEGQQAVFRAVRYWNFDKAETTKWLNSLVQEGANGFACEWGVPAALFDVGCQIETPIDFFTCLRDPYRRFISEFEFHDAFYTEVPNLTAPGSDLSPLLAREQRDSVKASDWVQRTLYWKRDRCIPFLVSINKPNYFVRMLCGLSDSPDAVLDESHLAQAKSMLDLFSDVIILEDNSTHAVIRKYGHNQDSLPRVLGKGSADAKLQRKDKTLVDISEEQFKALNALDYELYQYAKTLSKSKQSTSTSTTMELEHSRVKPKESSRRVDIPLMEAGLSRRPIFDAIMSQTDIVVPLKTRGVIFRAVLGAVYSFYRPRRLIVVSCKSEIAWLQNQLPNWQRLGEVGEVECADEETLFEPLGFTRSSLKIYFQQCASELRKSTDEQIKQSIANAGEREFGWWYQQLLKLGVGSMLKLSSNYFVWDADLIPLKKWDLCGLNDNGCAKFFTAILQKESRNPALANEYSRAMLKLTGVSTAQPEGGGTFVCHHMAFNQHIVDQMLKRMESRRGLSWPKAILGIASEHPRFSEYLTYSSFALAEYPKQFHYHPFSDFGEGGFRLRGGNEVVSALLSVAPTLVEAHDVYGGFSYSSFCEFAREYFKNLDNGLPSYVQLDHVYANSDSPNTPLYDPAEYSQKNDNLALWEYEKIYVQGHPTIGSPINLDFSKQRSDKLSLRKEFWWNHFRKQQCLFVHIPKNAGTSVEYFYTQSLTPCSQHFTAREFKTHYPDDFDKLLKFCVVRNPYSRFLSAYNYLLSGGNNTPGSADLLWQKELQKFSLIDYLHKIFPNASEPSSWDNRFPVHFIPQYLFVTDETGVQIVDKILPLDELVKNPVDCLKRNQIPLEVSVQGSETFPHLRVSPLAKAHLVLDKQSAEILYQVYKKDFEMFGFAKDSWQS